MTGTHFSFVLHLKFLFHLFSCLRQRPLCLPSKNRADRRTADSEQTRGRFCVSPGGICLNVTARSYDSSNSTELNSGESGACWPVSQSENCGCHTRSPPQRMCAQSWSQTSLAAGAGSSQRPQSGTVALQVGAVGASLCAAGRGSLVVRLSLAGRIRTFLLSPVRSGR